MVNNLFIKKAVPLHRKTNNNKFTNKIKRVMANKKCVGYQIQNKKNETPNGLFSFQVFRTLKSAYNYCKENDVNTQEFFISKVYENEIENITYLN